MTACAWLFTFVTAGRQPVLTRPEVMAALRDAVGAELERSGAEILALVILPDHVHCVARAGRRGALPCWRSVKTEVAHRLRSGADEEAPFEDLWHPGHQARPLADAAAVAQTLESLHADPVAHALVEDALEWPWSTLRRHHRQLAHTASRPVAGRWRRGSQRLGGPAASLPGNGPPRRAQQPVLWR